MAVAYARFQKEKVRTVFSGPLRGSRCTPRWEDAAGHASIHSSNDGTLFSVVFRHALDLYFNARNTAREQLVLYLDS